MRPICVVFIVALIVPVMAGQSRLRTYADAAHGVSFEYPAGWTLGKQSAFYLLSVVADADHPPYAVVSLPSKGQPYAKTNVAGLEVTYVPIAAADEAGCLRRVMANISTQDKKPEAVTIHGIRFTHITTGDAGMCHQANREIYATYRGGSCLLFEATVHSVCPDPDAGRMPASAELGKSLRVQLDSIIQSIRVKAPV